jgi:hypothetical protein
MAKPTGSARSEAAFYRGEVWTDGRGYATVSLAAEAGRLPAPREYTLRTVEPACSARVVAELWEGRFTIATDQPHVKVAWRITGRRPAGHQSHPRREEETT